MTSKDLPFEYDIGRRSNFVCKGQDIQVENINAYICQPPYYTNKAVIVIHDKDGFPDITICPDFFLGKEPWKPTNKWEDFRDWLNHRDPMKVDRTADIFVTYLKEQYNAMKIGTVGFSWGGMAVHHLMLTNRELKAGVSFYGIIRDSDHRYDLLNPTFFIFGGNDHTISLDQVILLEEKLKEYCKVPYKVKVYPKQVHSFAQYKPEDMKPEDAPYIEEARMDMIDWLNRYIMF